MPSFKDALPQALRAMGGSPAEAARARRAGEVRRMWEHIMLLGGDEYILAHTNNVFILRPEEARTLRRDHDDRKDAGATGTGKQLVAYVDESIVAAELNARRELVKLQFFEHFGERIDEFKIIISRGQYKAHHPFVREAATPSYAEPAASAPLDEDERAMVDAQLARIEDAALRRAVQRAMVADLEWKKGLAAEMNAGSEQMFISAARGSGTCGTIWGKGNSAKRGNRSSKSCHRCLTPWHAPVRSGNEHGLGAAVRFRDGMPGFGTVPESAKSRARPL